MNKEIIDAINNSPYQAYFAITGGGQSFLGEYMSISGASKTVVGAIVPYSTYAFDKFVKWKVESYASDKAARQLAVACYNECLAAGVPTRYAVGIGCTCVLAKANEREGRKHKIFIAAHTRNKTYTFHSVPKRPSGDTDIDIVRMMQEEIVAKQILYVLNRMTVKHACDDMNYACKDIQEYAADGVKYSELLENPNNILLTNFNDTHETLAIFPGSWNPIHTGHHEIAKIAQEVLGVKPILELSINNVDKGQLDAIEISDRTMGIASQYPVAITNAPTFVEKARKFRARFGTERIVFIVGADTWNRIWDEKYAGPLDKVANTFRDCSVQFLVFGRNGHKPVTNYVSNNFCIGPKLIVESEVAANFNMPVSSTEIRKETSTVAGALKAMETITQHFNPYK